MKNRSLSGARFATTALTAAALMALCGNALALGLGRLSVMSVLGEPLRAEIDVTSITPDEASSLLLKIASPDAYRAAGVDYNAALGGAQVTLAQRPDGRPYLRINSERAVSEPFIDVILEMTWSSGRLVREYTLLLDPPRAAAPAVAAAPAAAPMTAPAPRPQAPAAAAAATARPPAAAAPAPARAASSAVASAPAKPAPVRRRPTPAKTAAAAAPAVPASGGVTVRPGDTLSGIAVRQQPAGVSLDQMLVALFRANPQAFMGDNMNRLRAGVVLSLPSADEARAVGSGEAREIIVAQSADFNAYRRKLAAGVPLAGEGPSRQAAGKVQAEVEDRKQAAAATPDKLKLSQGAVKGAPTPEAAVSKETAAKEAAARVAELSRNVEELKKLKGSAATTTTPPAPTGAAPAATAQPASAATPAMPMPAPAAMPASVPGIVAPAPTVVAALPASVPLPPAREASAPPAPAAPAASAAEAPAVAQAAASAAAPKAPPPVTAEEPGFVDSLLDSPFILPGAGILALVLAGVGVYRLRGRNRKAGGETSFLESRLQPDSFFGASGGQRVDTHDAGASTASASSSMSYSLSQLDAIGDVDPVAEADVYLAYGRDLQAEEILKEAMRATPERLAIRTKLLEVYAKRRDTKGFELLATQLFALTKGTGDEWIKAQELGRTIDPDNALYAPGGQPDALVRDGDRIIEPLDASTLPQSVMPAPSGATAETASLTDADVSQSAVDLDIDLGFESDEPVHEPAAPTMPEVTQPYQAAAESPAPTFEPDALPSMEDLGIAPPPAVEATAVLGERREDMDSALDFDLGDISLDLDAPAPAPAPLARDSRPSKLDSSFTDFDLPEGPDSRFNEDGDPLERKVELADEFRQIGDLEGARDLLTEVVSQAEGALKVKAQNMLDRLG